MFVVIALFHSSDIDLDAEALPSKRARIEGEEDTDFSMASLARGEIKEVQTLWQHTRMHTHTLATNDEPPLISNSVTTIDFHISGYWDVGHFVCTRDLPCVQTW